MENNRNDSRINEWFRPESATKEFILGSASNGDVVFRKMGGHEQPVPFIRFRRKHTMLHVLVRDLSRLIEATREDEKQLIVSLGCGRTIEPLQTAASVANTNVIALDYKFGHDFRAIEMEDSDIPRNGSHSLAVGFELNIFETDIVDQVQADRVQVFFPDPWNQRELLVNTTRLVKPGGEIMFVIDPCTISNESSFDGICDESLAYNEPRKILEDLKSSGQQVELMWWDKKKVKEIAGADNAEYFPKEEGGKVPVIWGVK